MENELGIEDHIEFHNVHRLRKRTDGKPRGIIAKFTKFKDKVAVLKAAPEKLKDKPNYSVNQQYPTEVVNRRRQLIPIMKEARRREQRANLVVDKLYIDGRLYEPQTDRYGMRSNFTRNHERPPPTNQDNGHPPGR